MPLSTKKSLKVTGAKNEAGLTLIEMLVTLSITAFLFLVLSQFLLSGVQLWAKNDHAYRRQHLLNLVFQSLNRDLGAMIPGGYLPEVAASGDQYQFKCWIENEQGLIQLEYRYDQQERKVYRIVGFWGGQPVEKVLLEEVDDWKFEYFQAHSKRWLITWSPEQRSEVPALIKVTFKTKLGDLGSMIIPVNTAQDSKEDSENE